MNDPHEWDNYHDDHHAREMAREALDLEKRNAERLDAIEAALKALPDGLERYGKGLFRDVTFRIIADELREALKDV